MNVPSAPPAPSVPLAPLATPYNYNPGYTHLIAPQMKAMPPPSYNYSQSPPTKSEKFTKIMEKYEITSKFSEKLFLLEDYDIVFLFDDSSSMNTPVKGSDGLWTRWTELQYNAKIILDIANVFNGNFGVNIHFLNRPVFRQVVQEQQLVYIFKDSPLGRTPLTKKCEEIFELYRATEKPVLLIIATDGVPTNRQGDKDLKSFRELLKNKDHSKFFISFLACSDNASDIGYLNKLDNQIPGIDTLDDYQSELKEVLRAQGRGFKYTHGDHIVRLLLGPICPELDALDEPRCFDCVIL